MKPGAAETAPLLQKLDETNQPKPGAIAAAVRQAKRGVGVFGVALALSGVLVAVLNAPDTTKTAFELQDIGFRYPRGETLAPLADRICVENNQCVGCTRQFFTKSCLGDDVAALVPSSGEEPTSPRHRAGVASMAWRSTRLSGRTRREL